MQTRKELAQLAQARDIDGLISALNADEDGPVNTAISFLGQLGDVRAVPSLIEVLANRNVAPRAAKVLGKLGDPQAINPLIDTFFKYYWERTKLRDGMYFVEAIKKLGQDGVQKLIIELIKKYMKDRKRGHSIQDRRFALHFLRAFSPEEVGIEFENLLLLDEAIEWYTKHEMLEEAARVRKKQVEMGAAMVSQKVVHGDEITTVQDSVVNRSIIGGADELLTQLERLAKLKEDGHLTGEEFLRAKKKLLAD